MTAGREQDARETRLSALADEWEQEAAEDERYLNSPRAHYTECQELPAVIARSREHVAALRAALLPSPPATDGDAAARVAEVIYAGIKTVPHIAERRERAEQIAADVLAVLR